MQHNAAFHQGLHCKGDKDLLTIEYNILENYKVAPLNMYNGLSQVYCINQKEEPINIQRVNTYVPLIVKQLKSYNINLFL